MCTRCQDYLFCASKDTKSNYGNLYHLTSLGVFFGLHALLRHASLEPTAREGTQGAAVTAAAICMRKSSKPHNSPIKREPISELYAYTYISFHFRDGAMFITQAPTVAPSVPVRTLHV